MLSNDDSPLPDTEVHYLRSKQVGDEFKVLVGHCGSSERTPGPVVFVGDAWGGFGTAVETIRLLRLSEVVPPLLVVGVCYRTTDMGEIERLRGRDFTPTVDPSDGRDVSMLGGADQFLAFMRDELGSSGCGNSSGSIRLTRMFFGDSLGGLFATYVLLNQPDTFRRYGIGSPALDWDEELMFKHEAEYAQAHHDLPAKVFFSVGAYENLAGWKHFLEQRPPDERAKAAAEWDDDDPLMDCVAPTERMVAVLRGRAYPSLEIECEVLPGEYHDTAPPLNLSRSLRYLFDAPR